jgi:hypothetical protein
MAYIGTELVEGLRRWMRWDDRGQSFGMWRWEDTIETGRNLVDEKVQELKAVVHLQQRSIKHLQRYGQELRVQFEARQPGMNEVSDGLKRVEEMYQEFELTLVDELIQSIENFQHRIDSAGVMILTMDLPTTI